jgi:hypothetical protein
MKVHAVKPNVDANTLLPGAQFIDAYSVTVNDAASWTCSRCRSSAIDGFMIGPLPGLRLPALYHGRPSN